VEGNTVIPYGKWHSVAVRWGSINSYTGPLPFKRAAAHFKVETSAAVELMS